MSASVAIATTKALPAPPRHVGVIMDGNARWARARGLSVHEGHRHGLDALHRVVQAAPSRGVRWLTFYGFSRENWHRPAEEVSGLMDLARSALSDDLDVLDRQGVRVRMVGERDGLDEDIRAMAERAERQTEANVRLNLTIAFNYGGWWEMARCAREAAVAVRAGRLAPETIDEAWFAQAMASAFLPPLDLVVRTGGERRLSNFLPWQAAYAEFVFDEAPWPDFDIARLDAALLAYAGRARRFGGREGQA